ncbi:MAG: cytochrome c oxidase subunit II, partial [Ilumatobacteraceae bacterium]
MPPPLTEQASDIDRVWAGFFIIAVVVGVLVAALVAIVVIRFRRRPGNDALPEQTRAHIPLEIAYTVVPLLIVIGLFAVTFVSVRALDEVDPPADVDLVVDVTGFQWQFQFDYPASGVTVTGTDDTAPELVLPTGASVRFDLTSIDVIHSFWIPGFRFKRDMFPGQVQSFQVDVADRTGFFEDTGVCAEFCGLDHHKMRFSVRVVTP